MVAFWRGVFKVQDFNRPPNSFDEAAKAAQVERMELYKLLVEMADRVSQRRQSANNFYLSVNTLLVGGSAYLGTTSSTKDNLIISLAGSIVGFLWIKSIESYKTLNTAKFLVINDLERTFSHQPFTKEWKWLDPEGVGQRHKPFHKTERTIPKLFIGIYLFQALASVPWSFYPALAACKVLIVGK